ncbi:hypothetical protein PS619_03881 [Pseudomonas fluorescens]|nr:hypothetical protein PS619_03881 [Pseudomonas fluorescens]
MFVWDWDWDWGHIRCCGCCRWRFRSYSDSLFQTPKSKQKALPLAYGTSLRLSVPSLRCPSGGIAYGLLRCTSSRCMRLRRTALCAYPRMNTSARPADGAKDQKPKPKPKQDHKPLTLALSRRERGLTAWTGGDTPTCDSALNSDFEKPTNRLPLPRERAGVRGESNTEQKPTACSSPLNRMSVSSAAALDL